MINRGPGVLIFLLCFLSAPVFAQNDIIARVGGVPITAFELNVEVQKLRTFYGTFHNDFSQEKIGQIREEAMNNLIERNRKVRYALQERVYIDNQTVEEAFQEARESLSFQDALRQEADDNVAAYRGSVYRDLLAVRAEQSAVESRIGISDEQVRAYYEDHKERFRTPRQFRASHILVKVDPEAGFEEKAALKSRAEELADRAKAGEDFYSLAYYNSDERTRFVGGDLGYFHEGQKDSELEVALLDMNPGQIAGPVRSVAGWHVIKLVDKKPSKQLPFEEMEPMIRQQLEEKRRAELYEAWMSSLREKFPVERIAQ